MIYRQHAAPRLLRRDVPHRPEHVAQTRLRPLHPAGPLPAPDRRQPEIHDPGPTCLVYQNLGGLQVPVNHALLVNPRHDLAHPAEHPKPVFQRCRVVLEPDVERETLHQLHREVRRTMYRPRVHIARDLRTVQSPQNLDLPRQKAVISIMRGEMEDLQRDKIRLPPEPECLEYDTRRPPGRAMPDRSIRLSRPGGR